MTHNTDTHRVHHIPPLELLKCCFQTQETFQLLGKICCKQTLCVWCGWLIHFSSSPSCKPPLGILILPACLNMIRTSRINTVLHTAGNLCFCFSTFNYCIYRFSVTVQDRRTGTDANRDDKISQLPSSARERGEISPLFTAYILITGIISKRTLGLDSMSLQPRRSQPAPSR